MKVETHNHPTAISPFPGAATGSGGEIRDEGATGRGAKPKAGLTGFSVSNLRIPGFVRPWERELRQARAHRLGARDHARGADRRRRLQQRIRPARPSAATSAPSSSRPRAMRAGACAAITSRSCSPAVSATCAARTSRRPRCRSARSSCVLGGPAMLIGLGGGAASSVGSGSSSAELDFASVQRGNPEMQRRAQEVIDRCWALGDAQSDRARFTTSAPADCPMPCPRRSAHSAARRAHRPARDAERRAAACRRWRSGATRRRSATCWRIAPRALAAIQRHRARASAARSP